MNLGHPSRKEFMGLLLERWRELSEDRLARETTDSMTGQGLGHLIEPGEGRNHGGFVKRSELEESPLTMVGSDTNRAVPLFLPGVQEPDTPILSKEGMEDRFRPDHIHS